jgi:hypothetical protein
MARVVYVPSSIARFWTKVRFGLGCWEWQGARDRDGYGWFKHRKRMLYAHRFAWAISNGQRAGSLQVLHDCDNPSCVRPGHLRLGTNLDNRFDAQRKGRLATGDRNGARLHPERLRRGDAHGTSKISDAAVREIRHRYARGEKQQALADEFGISNQQVSNIIRGASRTTA